MTALRVAIDVSAITAGNTGVARYGRQLVAALPAAGVEVVPFAFGRGPYDPPPRTRRIGIPRRVLEATWALTRQPSVDRFVSDVSVVHTLDLAPAPTSRPTVVTVHDVAALDHPDLHPPRAVAAQAAQLAAARRADAVCVVSVATATALADRGVDPTRVHVTHNGVTDLGPGRAPDRRPYLLYVGELAARKGLVDFVAAYTAARDGRPDFPDLVLAGGDGFGAADVHRAVDGRGGVEVLGPMGDAELAGLYDSAVAVALPSVAEGFGLPVLEAMARGVPVVASDLPVLREVGGDVPVWVAPGEWVEALRSVVDDEADRAARGRAGPSRAARFSWDACAAATAAVYRAVSR